jgi:hypothetical protein
MIRRLLIKSLKCDGAPAQVEALGNDYRILVVSYVDMSFEGKSKNQSEGE